MTLNLQNVLEAKQKLLACDTSTFSSTGNSFKFFVRRIQVNAFRHIENLEVNFAHPVTVLSGTNKIGKTSLIMLLACSHEKFFKLDATSPTPSMREHGWSDVLSFTAHEVMDKDYSYELDWREGTASRSGIGKRLASSRAWSGLGKKSGDGSRVNAKIRGREVRVIDLERILPGRSFTDALFRKANSAIQIRVHEDVEKAFAYVFEVDGVEINEVGAHINRSCFLISMPPKSYSTFNAASGEESLIYLLKDIVESPKNSLILIDEMEAGFHPSIQRKLADIVQYIAWRDKKQFVITTHSPTLLSAFPPDSRRFVEKVGGNYRVRSRISPHAARSKMDSTGYPLVRLYCEDDLAKFLIRKILVRMAQDDPQIERLFDVICSGAINEVKNDYVRHKRNFPQYANKIGYCAVMDGDHIEHADYSHYKDNEEEHVLFLRPHDAPEKFLVKSYLAASSNSQLSAALQHENHHTLFDKMVSLGLATDAADARSQCYQAFKESTEFVAHESELRSFILRTVEHFAELPDPS